MKILWRVLIVFLVLAVVVLLLVQVASVFTGSHRAAAVARLKAKAKARGMKVDFGAPAPKAPRHDEPSPNDMTPELPPLPKDVPPLPGSAGSDDDGASSEMWSAWEHESRIRDQITSGHVRELTEEDVAFIRSWLQGRADELADARALAVSFVMPEFHPTDIGSRMDAQSPARHASNLLLLSGVLAAFDGDCELLESDVRSLLELGERLSADPIPNLMERLMGLHAANGALGIIQATTPEGLPEVTTSAIVALLGSGTGRERNTNIVYGEAIFSLTALAGEGPEIHRDEPSIFDDEPSRVEDLLDTILLRPFLDLGAARYADAMAELAVLAALPYYESRPQVEVLLQSLEGGLPMTRGIQRDLLPAAAGLLNRQAILDAQVDLARMGLLLEQHQAQHGAAPAGLEAIAPALGGTLPLDPFTGESYVYRPLADGFVLYSLGFNGTDDQGVHNDAHGDIVWRGVPAEQDEADRTDE